MHVIVLAAGMGTRLGDLGEVTPKPLLPLGKGCVLDQVVTSVWVEGITTVKVVHNNHRSRATGEWPKKFKKWLAGVSYTADPGKRRESPYIRTLNNGISDPSERRGAVGDLAWAIRQGNRRDLPILVVCGDDLFPDPHLEDLKGFDGKTSAISVRSTNDLDPMVLAANPSQVRVDAGNVAEIGPDVPDTPWRYCGAFYVAGADVEFVLEYADTWKTAGVVADDIGGLIDSMVNDGRAVRAVKTATPFWSVGTKELYEEIRRRNMPKVRTQGPRGGKSTLLNQMSKSLTAADVQRLRGVARGEKVNK